MNFFTHAFFSILKKVEMNNKELQVEYMCKNLIVKKNFVQ